MVGLRPNLAPPDAARRQLPEGPSGTGEPGRRAALRHARVVLHQPAGQGRGTIPDLILQADELVRIRADLEAVLSEHTGQSVETLRHDTDRDRIFTASAARDYGLIDEIRLRPRSLTS